jgi:hypothetical protein
MDCCTSTGTVPPSSNPKSKLNQDFVRQIDTLAVWKKIEDGSVLLQFPDNLIPKLGKIRATVVLISKADQTARRMEPRKGEFEWDKR